MFRLALPVLAEQSLNVLVFYTDWWLIGHFLVGADFKAAMGQMGYTLWLLSSLFAAAAIGATALVARYVGAGNYRVARHVTNQALLTGAVIAVAATAAAAMGGGSFFRLMQLEPEPARLATQYLSILTPAIPAIMLQEVGTACLHGAGDTLTGFLIKLVVNVINMAVSASLVIGLGPLPVLGWTGLAIGTACGHGLGGLLLLIVLVRGRAGLRIQWRQLWPDVPLIRRLLRIGLPGGIDMLAVLTCHLIYVAIINSLGTLSAAAHGLGVQIEALAYLPGHAFQVAAATIAGQYLGGGDPRRATRGVLTTLAVGGSLVTGVGVFFFFGGHLLTTFFLGDPLDPTGLLTARLLRVVALSLPSQAIATVLTGALRGAGDTFWPLVITFIGFVLVRIPGACLLAWHEIPIPGAGIYFAGFGLGVMGAWWAMVADTVVRSVLVTLRFWQGKWTKVVV